MQEPGSMTLLAITASVLVLSPPLQPAIPLAYLTPLEV